jgi:UDP-N-acetylmuramoyl-L-alanyl-D-glutamate--2,6-diaminopimelate ligase
MKLNELVTAIGAVTECDADIGRIEYDSRIATADTLFVCLVGASADGHDYAPVAYQSGCRAFLTERVLDLPSDAVQIVTKDTRAALADISAKFYGYPARELRIIGITGTKGKTTTALLVSAILNKSGMNCAYIGSNGVMINGVTHETMNTTPESRDLHRYFRLMADSGVKYAVIEVSSQALAHHRVRGIEFEAAAYTNLSPDHIGAGEHRDFDDYMMSKEKLFSSHGAKHIVYNADDDYAHIMIKNATGECVSYGINADADYKGGGISPYRDETSLGVRFEVSHAGGYTDVSLRSPGKFSVYNGLCAIAICRCLGVTTEDSAAALRTAAVQGRFEIVDGLRGRTFIIDYAHNGLSLTSALGVLKEYNASRLICVFGSVGGRTKGRRAELAHAASNMADLCIITSDNPNYELPSDIISDIVASYDGPAPYITIEDRDEAVRCAVRLSREGDIVLFAGKGHETYQLIYGKKEPFSERDIIMDECDALLRETQNV